MLSHPGRVGYVGQPLGGGGDGSTFSQDYTTYQTGQTPPGMTGGRASAANYWNSSGVRTAANPDAVRFDYNPLTLQSRGLLIEEQATNFLLNSLSPANQTVTLSTGSFTLWMEGTGSVAVAAGTAVGTGFGTASNSTGIGTYGTFVPFTITTAGTVTVTITGSVTAFQLETGSGPTSMITTTSAAATRAADNFNLISFPWNSLEGTLVVDSMIGVTPSAVRKILAITQSSGSEAELVDMFYAANVRQTNVRSANTVVAMLNQVSTTMPMTLYRMATAMKLDDYALAINGTLVGTDTSGAMPAGVLDTIALGRRSLNNNSQYLNGWIRKQSYYPTRLTNSQIQSLTTIPPQPALRSVAAENRIYHGSETRGVTNYITRVGYTIGTGDVTELVLNNAANELGQSGNGPTPLANDFTIVKASIEKDGAGYSVPVYFNGSRSVTVTGGSFDINSDPVYPGLFGQSKFSQGEKYWVRMECTVPTTAGRLPFNAKTNIPTGTAFWWYDPALTTITNGADGSGVLARTGNFPDVRSSGYNPVLLGRFANANTNVYVGIGDSIHFGTGDTATIQPGNGYGIFQRAMTAGDGLTAPIASLNLNRHGATTADFNNDWVKSYYKYGNVLVDELGTNDIGTAGSGVVATIQTNIAARWADFKVVQPAGKIVRTYYLPRTTSTDSFATTANQSYVTDWAPGGKSNQLNDWFETKKTDGTVNAILGRSSVNDTIEPYKWLTNGTNFYLTTDGTHPSYNGHSARGAELRTLLLSGVL
jgi:lysophospholipase L1-like esterase